MSLDKCAEILSDFGITFNQAKVYITTVQLGIASVSYISKTSNVPREEVYRLLPKLQELGLVEKILGRPTRVKATPIEDALSILIKREKDIALKRVSALVTKKDEFRKIFNALKIKPEFEETTHFTLISQREAVIRKEFAMIEAGERTFDITTSGDHFIHFFTKWHESLKKAINKGVKFRMVLEKTQYDDLITGIIKVYELLGASFSLRLADQPLSHYIVVDYREALMATCKMSDALGKHPYLWTNDSGLVELMSKNFESLWQTSAEIGTMKSKDANAKLMHFLRDLRPTDHISFFYRSSEAKYDVLCNYLKVGLENGEAAVYIASEERPSQTKEAMKRFGIEVEKYEETGALRILGYDEFYIIDGKFSTTNTINLWNKLYDEALKHGFKGLRVTGETSCFFEHNLIQELIEYERTIRRILDTPIIAICAYNTNIFTKTNRPMDLYNELLNTHSTILFTGRDNRIGRFEIRHS